MARLPEKFEPGRLRDRITIRRLTDAPTGKGGQTRTWATIAANIAAEVISISGREEVIANTLQGTATYRITIRHRAGIRTNDQVQWRGQELNILGPPVDPTGRRQIMQITADTSAPQNA